MTRRPLLHRFAAALAAAMLGACATPATQVEVPTLPMRDALEQARQQAILVPPRADPLPKLLAPVLPEGAPRPLLSTPDVRLAYLYEWVDFEGNKHFGEWVAIPVSGFDWIMSDGGREPLNGSTGGNPPAAEKP
jgi:hypothetical protein